jgi:ethanolamine utilization protein EutM
VSDSGALGLIETRGFVAAVQAADAALKAASVRLVGIRKTNPALMTVQVTGDTAAVRSAVDAGKAAAELVGTVVSTHVIPRPSRAVARMQGVTLLEVAGPSKPAGSSPATKSARTAPKPKKSGSGPSPAIKATPSPSASETPDLASLTVRELRALARVTEGLSIKGREIARAGKAELLKAFGR